MLHFHIHIPPKSPFTKGGLGFDDTILGLWVEMGSYRGNREISVQSVDNEHIARRFLSSSSLLRLGITSKLVLLSP